METCFLALSFHIDKVFSTLDLCSLTLVNFILTLGIQTLVKTLTYFTNENYSMKKLLCHVS